MRGNSTILPSEAALFGLGGGFIWPGVRFIWPEGRLYWHKIFGIPEKH